MKLKGQLTQPPPRGCVLKQVLRLTLNKFYVAAASARLCVETVLRSTLITLIVAAASARLCVETANRSLFNMFQKQPPPRGCVLKLCYPYK